ncbi:MAG: hypothetical protein QOE82_2569 [Thermoanaerobaculia bacterium]|nr:hypothetical protein [Thermoanaerobaculia bacterium]
MTSTLIAILSLIVLGIPITLAIDRSARGPLLIGAAYLYGSGTMFLILLTLSIVHLHWTLIAVTVVALLIFSAAAILAGRQPGNRATRQPSNSATQQPSNPKPHAFDAITILIITAYALYATLASLWEWDYWAIWGLKAEQFLEIGGIDWRFLESRWNTFAHPDYPLLVPMNFDFVALINGGWSDRWLGLLFVAWGIALLLVVRALASRETTPFYAALLTMAVAGLAVSRYVGLAEGTLIAFGGAGVLFIRTALIEDDRACWRHGALMLGFAANCKNEGMALLVAATIAVIAVAWSRSRAVSRGGGAARPRNRETARPLRYLASAYALAAPWLILRAFHTLPTDIAGGSATSRLLARLPYAHQILGFLAARLNEPWFWVAILAGILIAPTAARRREVFVFLVTAIQLLFYVAAYLSTPHNIRWHVLTSWPRLTAQIAVPITVAVFLMLANSLRRSQDAPHAEVGSDQ